MRTSGRGSSETMMFIAPAVILSGFFVWLFGDVQELLRIVDRSILSTVRTGLAWVMALVS